MRTDRLLSSTGIRLALVQAAVLVGALTVTGTMIYSATGAMLRHEAEERARAEALSLRGGFVEDGLGNAREAIAHRVGRGSGLHYRLTAPDGKPINGDLPRAAYPPGAGSMTLHLPGDAGVGRFETFTLRLDGKAVVTVGQDLEFADRLLAALLPILIGCGVVGALAGILVSVAINRGVVRRIDALAQTARLVSGGDLSVRVPVRPGRAARDDIDALTFAINDMLDEIGRLVRNIRQVSADVAHDLRTPLTRVRQRIELLRAEAKDHPGLLNMVRRIDADLEGVLHVFSAMLRLAEIETGANVLNRTPVDLAQIGIYFAELYRPDIEHSERSLDVDIAPAAVIGDPELIGQAIANLLENAMRHTPAGSTIRITTRLESGVPVLAVADDGLGIAEADRPRVLDRFYRLERSRTTQGSGLGLALVAAIARRHDAVLTLEDAAPGLIVTLAFPPA